MERIKVPSKPEIINWMLRIERDHRIAFSSDMEKWIKNYPVFMDRAFKEGTPEATWFNSCRKHVDQLFSTYRAKQ